MGTYTDKIYPTFPACVPFGFETAGCYPPEMNFERRKAADRTDRGMAAMKVMAIAVMLAGMGLSLAWVFERASPSVRTDRDETQSPVGRPGDNQVYTLLAKL